MTIFKNQKMKMEKIYIPIYTPTHKIYVMVRVYIFVCLRNEGYTTIHVTVR